MPLLYLPAAGHFADIAAHAVPIRHIVTGCLAHALVPLQPRTGEARGRTLRESGGWHEPDCQAKKKNTHHFNAPVLAPAEAASIAVQNRLALAFQFASPAGTLTGEVRPPCSLMNRIISCAQDATFSIPFPQADDMVATLRSTQR